MKFEQRSQPQCCLKDFSIFEVWKLGIERWLVAALVRASIVSGRVIDNVPRHQPPTTFGGGSGTHFEKVQYRSRVL